MNVNEYIASETKRQSGTPAEERGMHEAYGLMVAVRHYNLKVEESTILRLASLINGVPGYRRVPAVFNQGVPALPPPLIPRAMANLVAAIPLPPVKRNYAGFLTKEFLEIHPFADGNGRVGSLLWNYLCGNLLDPEPMPYFFGEQ